MADSGLIKFISHKSITESVHQDVEPIRIIDGWPSWTWKRLVFAMKSSIFSRREVQRKPFVDSLSIFSDRLNGPLIEEGFRWAAAPYELVTVMNWRWVGISQREDPPFFLAHVDLECKYDESSVTVLGSSMAVPRTVLCTFFGNIANPMKKDLAICNLDEMWLTVLCLFWLVSSRCQR